MIPQFNTGDEVTQVIAVDLDGDGLDEIVASSMSFNVYVIKGDGKTILWRTDLGEVVTGIAVGDFNGDGKLEVAAGVADGFVHLLSYADGKVLSRYRTDGPIVTLIAADVDGDGADEIVFGHSDTPQVHGVQVYDAVDATGAKWQKHLVDAGGMATEDLIAADVTGDGRVDIIAGGRATHNVKLYINSD